MSLKETSGLPSEVVGGYSRDQQREFDAFIVRKRGHLQAARAEFNLIDAASADQVAPGISHQLPLLKNSIDLSLSSMSAQDGKAGHDLNMKGIEDFEEFAAWCRARRAPLKGLAEQ